MKIRHLECLDDIIKEIGRERLERVIGRGSSAISNWKADGAFPPNTYVAIQHELLRINCSAPARLWKMIEPKKQSRAA